MKRVFHACITPDCVLVEERNEKIKLVGFGVAAFADCRLPIAAGKQAFIAPDVAGQDGYDASSDIFSLGRLILHLFPEVSSHRALAKATALRPQDRFSKIREFKSELPKIFSSYSGAPKTKRRGGLIPKSEPAEVTPKLLIRTNPEKASVKIDGKLIGIAGSSGLRIPWDQGTITIEKDGYEKLVLVYKELPKILDVYVDLEPEMAPVTILTEPAEVMVSVDGKDLGLSSNGSLHARVSLGKRTFTLKKAGYSTEVFHVTLEDSRQARIGPLRLTRKANLRTKPEDTTDVGGQAAEGTDSGDPMVPWPVTIISEPAGASVSIDGRYWGVTSPHGLKVKIAAGKRKILVQKTGYKPKEVVYEIDRLNTFRIWPINLEPIPSKSEPGSTQSKSTAKLLILTRPVGASVIIDGKYYGTTSKEGLSVEVVPGKRKISLQMPGYEPKEVYCNIDSIFFAYGRTRIGPVDLVPASRRSQGALRFKNPVDNRIEEVWHPGRWTLLFGCLYFFAKETTRGSGAICFVGWLVVWWLFTGVAGVPSGLGSILSIILTNIAFSGAAESLIRNNYRALGWIEVDSDGNPVSSATKK